MTCQKSCTNNMKLNGDQKPSKRGGTEKLYE
jgi:hypothetical protein